MALDSPNAPPTTPPPTTCTGTSSPPRRAIDGLEKALAGLGLLDEALALDLRKPQDYFHRVWATALPRHRPRRHRAPSDDSDNDHDDEEACA